MVILHKLPLKPIENRKDLAGFSSVGETVEIDQFLYVMTSLENAFQLLPSGRQKRWKQNKKKNK